MTNPRPKDMPLRRGLSRVEAATYVGVGSTKFDEMVKDGRMPKPFKIDDRVLWDIKLIDMAVDDLVAVSRNEWDHVA